MWKDFRTADALVTALRLQDDPKHAAAYSYSTVFGYAMPIVEYVQELLEAGLSVNLRSSFQ